MKDENNTALKAGSWYVISNFLVKAVGILTTPIITRLISPAEFGVYNTYRSMLLIMTILGTLNILASVNLARYDFTDKEYDEYISSISILSIISTTLIYLLANLFGDFVVSWTGLPMDLFNMMFFNIIFVNTFDVLQSKHRAQMKYKAFVVLSLIVSILAPVLSIIFVSLQNSNRYLGYIFGTQLPIVIIGFFIFISIIKKGKTFYNKKYWHYALTISVPLIPHALSNNLLSQSDRVLINRYKGPGQVGLYSLAYSYSSVLATIWTSFNQAWAPWFYGKMKEESHEEIKYAVMPYTYAFSLFFIGMLAVGPEALRIFGPAEYQDGVWVIPPVLLGLFFQFVYSLYVNIEIFYKRTVLISLGTMSAALFNIVGNILLIPSFGFIGAAYTTLAGYILLFTIHYYFANRLAGKDIIGNRFIIKWVILMCLLTTIFTLLTNYFLIRYILLAILLVVFYLRYKDYINDFINKQIKPRFWRKKDDN